MYEKAIGWLLVGFVFGTAFGLGINDARAASQELAAKTDVGEIVITSTFCDVNVPPTFLYRAYATEGEKVHEGCWYREENAVHIFYPELDATAVYNPALFKPKE